MVTEFSDYTLQIQEANQQVDHLHRELQSMRQMAYDNTLLKQENQRLKGLLALEEQFDQRSTQVAYILQEYADPYTHKVVINKGSLHNIKAGSPVLDHQGVVGQVTQVFPTTSEVTLVADGKFMIPIKNLRTNTRGIAYGSPAAPIGNMELRFTLSNTDIMVGDKLVTSGIDGIYPAGLLVARVLEVQRKQNMAFSQIYLGSIGQPQKGITLLILSPE
jgi:rod shape-determining protein MreC